MILFQQGDNMIDLNRLYNKDVDKLDITNKQQMKELKNYQKQMLKVILSQKQIMNQKMSYMYLVIYQEQ